MSRPVLFIILAVAIGAGGYWAFGQFFGAKPDAGGRAGGAGAGARPTFVVAAAAGEADFASRIEAVGTAKSRESVTITAKATDTISGINFRDGQFVPKNFVIAEMTSTQQSAQLAEARAALREAEQQFGRAQQLAASGNASKALLDQRRAARDTAAARVRAQESQVADRLIRAPFAGVLGLRQVSVGSLVRPGDAIATLDDVSTIKLDMAIAETWLAVLKEGLPVTAKAAGYPDLVLQGALTGVDSRVDPAARTATARAEIPNPNGVLKPGMLLTATLEADKRRSLAAPEESIVALAGDRFVYVVGADGAAERRAVKTGRRKPGFVEILDGLRRGEMVVTEGVVKLRPGAPVTLNPPGPRPSGAPKPAAPG